MEIVNTGTVANDGTGDKLRDAFIIVNQNFQELQPKYKTLTFNSLYEESVIEFNTPLIVGRTYLILTLNDGDNFDNVGYTGEKYFVATGEYPVIWSNGTIVRLVNHTVTKFQDDFTNTIIKPDYFLGTRKITVSVDDNFGYDNTIVEPYNSSTFYDGIIVIDDILNNHSVILNIKRWL